MIRFIIIYLSLLHTTIVYVQITTPEVSGAYFPHFSLSSEAMLSVRRENWGRNQVVSVEQCQRKCRELYLPVRRWAGYVVIFRMNVFNIQAVSEKHNDEQKEKKS